MNVLLDGTQLIDDHILFVRRQILEVIHPGFEGSLVTNEKQLNLTFEKTTKHFGKLGCDAKRDD